MASSSVDVPDGPRTNAQLGEELRNLIVDYMLDFQDKRGYNPTIAQVAAAMDRTKSVIHSHLRRLAAEGAIRVTPRGYVA